MTLDGAPLDEAEISFDAGDGTIPVSFEVRAGQFSGEAIVGEKTVRIFAMRPSKPNPRLGPTDVQNPFENILPEKYGYNSEITLEVGGGNDTENLSYELRSK